MRILVIAHAYDNRGGVEEHIKTLVSTSGAEAEWFILVPEEGGLLLISPRGERRMFAGHRLRVDDLSLSHPSNERSLQQVLQVVQPAVVHVQHWLGWQMSLWQQLQQSGIPYVISIHDYFALTPHFTMQGVPHGTHATADVLSADYAKATLGRDVSGRLQHRREVIRSALRNARQVICPGEYVRQIHAELFEAAYLVIEHGITPFVRKPKRVEPKIKFGFMGSFIPQKGWQVLVDAFVRARLPHELHLFGGRRDKDVPAGGSIFFHGPYDSSQVAEIVTAVDVGVIPSLFAETYSLVMSEFLQGGAPVIASHVGELAVRVSRGGSNPATAVGRTFPMGDGEALIQELRWFAEHADWRSWALPPPQNAAAMTAKYLQLYREIRQK